MIELTTLIRLLRGGAYAALLTGATVGVSHAQMTFGQFGATPATAAQGTVTPSDSTYGTYGTSGNMAGSVGVNSAATGVSNGGNMPGGGAGINLSGPDSRSLQSNSFDPSKVRGAGLNDRLDSTANGGRQRGGNTQSPQMPNQFQQFAQQATGRLLPIYGEELFQRPEVYAADVNGPVTDDYVLGPGDDVKVQVWGGVTYDGTLTIDRSGQVNIPRAGVVNLAGVRAKDVEGVLRSQLSNTFTNFNVNANLDRLRTIQVYVVGQAQQPGTYNVSSLSTLVNALFASGGPSANGSMRNIQLKRGATVVTTFDVYDFIGRGDKSQDVPLRSGDVIVIPPVGPRVAITGAYDQAAIYELKSNAGSQSSLNELLGLNGGVPVLATTRKALIERVIPGMNPPRQVQDLTLDTAGLSKPLQDGDIITLLNISAAFSNAVTLQGNVASPLRYRWFEGMRIKDLIPERDALITADYYQRKNLLVQNAEALGMPKNAGSNLTDRVRGMVDQINWDYAVVERLDRDRLRTQLIPFNLAAALNGNDLSQNIPLQAGDVVTVFSEKDLRLPVERQSRLVRIEGEVSAPGIYEALPGETLAQIIQRLGGVRPQAYLFGTEFSRTSVQSKQQENLDILIRRLEQQQQSQLLYLAANRPGDASQAALFQQQQIAARAQIAALRTLKSNGRISLELNPEQVSVAALPDLPLEDGDRIMVPSTPGFVSAVGAINNENVFIYRNGRTVGDIVQSAGLREEADRDLMFVLRADGSVVSRSDRKGFFGNSFDQMQVMPGDTVIVPEKLDRETTRNFVVRQLKDFSQIISQLGLGVAALKVLRDF